MTFNLKYINSFLITVKYNCLNLGAINDLPVVADKNCQTKLYIPFFFI